MPIRTHLMTAFRLVLPALPPLLVVQPAAAQPSLTGIVYVDRNANGARDAGEPGLAGVAVSDQNQVVVTGGDGAFRLSHSLGSGLVYVSVPDGYRAVGPFWRKADSASAERGFAFPLAPAPAPAEFVFIHASDTHISPASLARTQRLRAIVDSVKPAFVLITGDLVRDALRVKEAEATGYYELFRSERDKFSAPVWLVPGNHENFGIERHLSLVSPQNPLYARGMYHQYFGPDYYSFTFGGVHFVGLNTVDIDDLWYYGHVDSTQVEWLSRDLAAVPSTVPVVTFNHIPFFTSIETVNGYMDTPPAPTAITVRGKTSFRHAVSNAGEVIARISGHPYDLALGGHMHVREQLRYEGTPIRFFQTAAVVGPSEGGGLKLSSGVVVYHVKGGKIDDGHFLSF
ncbi:MAG TPA: metallophosphoesterase [Gemmatimonadales bacterium]|nr:metallophosphoesterase [Gemmatimonadales bacterium]